MKKILAFFMIFIMLGFTVGATISNINSEKKAFPIAEKIKSFMLINNPVALEKVKAASEKTVQNVIQDEIDYKIFKHIELTDADREAISKERRSSLLVIPEQSFYFYPMITVRYTKQYAEKSAFNSIIRGDKIWVAPCKIEKSPSFYYDNDYSEVPMHGIYKDGGLYPISDKKTIEFLNQPDMIEKMIKEQINEEITDCKIVAIPNVISILYLKGINTDYGIKLYKGDDWLSKEPANLENFKIYKMAELMDSVGKYKKVSLSNTLDEKPTYEVEGNALMIDGIIQGNDKGLDPLKPLSRIEATTILVRALGLDQTPTAEESKFSDIPNGHWGVKYANIAYDKGLTKGVGDNMFAPDQRIDANQFATLLLRNSEGTDIDWQQALKMLVEKGIITQESADKMDLFTRGDMAKIIYEAREKGLLKKT